MPKFKVTRTIWVEPIVMIAILDAENSEKASKLAETDLDNLEALNKENPDYECCEEVEEVTE